MSLEDKINKVVGRIAYDMTHLDDRQTNFLSDDMESMLVRQIGVEFYSAYIYYSMAAWFESKGLMGFASYYHRQASHETDHAMVVYKYLIQTGSDYQTLPEVPAPPVEFGSILNLTRMALDHEMKVTRDWEEIAELARDENPATLRLAQDFLQEQIEEEDGAVSLYQKVQLAETGAGILMLDRELRDRDPGK